MLSLLIIVNIVLFYFVADGFKASRQIQLMSLGSDIYDAIPILKLDDYAFAGSPIGAYGKDREKWTNSDVAGKRRLIAEYMSPREVANKLNDANIGHIVWTVIFVTLWLLAELLFVGGLLDFVK